MAFATRGPTGVLSSMASWAGFSQGKRRYVTWITF
jgi:hypothetical protein